MAETEVSSEAKETVAPLTDGEKAVAQVNQVVNNAIAALMDVANLLRDIPKLVAVNQQLAERLGLARGTTEEVKN